MAGDFDKNGTNLIVATTYETRKIEPKNRLKVRIWILATLAILVVSNILFDVLGLILFNPAEIPMDFSIFVFVTAIIIANYSPTRIARFMGLKKIAWDMILFFVIFLPLFTVLYILYSAGYSFVFSIEYSPVILISVFAVYFLVSASWRWNRKFVWVNTLGSIRMRIKADGDVETEKEESLSNLDEGVIRDYVRGKVGDSEFLSILGDTPFSRKLMMEADTVIKRLKEKYRW